MGDHINVDMVTNVFFMEHGSHYEYYKAKRMADRHHQITQCALACDETDIHVPECVAESHNTMDVLAM